jgi:hypothetical protein
MKAEYTAEDFERGVRNPYFSELNKKTEVAVRNEDYKVFREVGEQNGVSPEAIMRRCLADYAKKLREDE